MKKNLSKPVLSILALILALGSIAAAPTPPTQPQVTIEVVNGLPATLAIGESYTVEIRLTSDSEYLMALAMPAPQFPGRYVVFSGNDRSGRGTSTTLYLTLTGKDSTLADFPDGVPVHFFVGARFRGGVTVSEQFTFNVVVP